MRSVAVRVAADEALRALPGWEVMVRGTVEEVAEIYSRLFQVRWMLVEIVPWSSGDGFADGSALLDQLKKDVPVTGVEVVVGWSGRRCAPASSGKARPFSTHLVIMTRCDHPVGRAPAPARILSHEFAHLFGAFHLAPGVRSVMQAGGADDFDSQTARVIRLTRSMDFAMGVLDLDLATKRAWLEIYAEGHASDKDSHVLANAIRNVGRNLAVDGKVSESIPYFEEALRLDPTLSLALVDLGVSHTRLGRRDEAASAFRRALDTDPRSVSATQGLATILERQGRVAEAQAVYEAAIRLDGSSAPTRLEVGVLLIRRGQPREAEVHLREAVRLDDTSSRALDQLGVALGMQGRFAEALPFAQRAASLAPRSVEAHANLGFTLAQLGQLDEAIQTYRATLALDTEYIRTRFNLVTALTQAGRHDEAIGELQELVQRQPTNVQVSTAIVNSFIRRERYNEAWLEVHRARSRGLPLPPTLIDSLRQLMPEPDR
ncbi:MAG: tetratricopeptide repeat protein [candidate division NC10 bacterium]|nr:tetratricopeptide repeat protein [candidate division NC10 bacterium]